MLKVAKSFEYALFALRYIALNTNGRSISAKEISESENIPFDLLAKILQKLVKGRIISSQQGVKGGYQLMSTPNKVILSEIVFALENEIKLTECMVDNPTKDDCGRVNDCCIRNPLLKMQSKLHTIFDSTTLQEIIG
jgi:Rrf2 family protein